MKHYTTQERLVKMSELLDKLEKHLHELDKGCASSEYRGSLDNLDKRARHLASQMAPWDID